MAQTWDSFHGGIALRHCFSDLEKVLHAFRVVAVALSADPLHLLDLACFTGSLDVLEVDLWILAEVDNRAQKVEQA